jgi:hypothetical protein
MSNIAESSMLLRTRVELPASLKLVTEEFREGWGFARRVNAEQLEKKIHRRGWSFIKIADGVLRSGVGETSQLAISSALKLTLRHVNEHFNAVEVEHIELTQYPWFFLARIRVYPYLIQQGDVLPASDDAKSLPLPIIPERKRLSVYAPDLHPYFGSSMPQLKQMLILP